MDNFHIMATASRPRSKGNVRLASNKPEDPALIDPNYYDDYHDVEITIAGK